MTTPPPPIPPPDPPANLSPDDARDERVSAVLDGAATDDERAQVLADPVALARLTAFRQVSASLAAGPAPVAWADDALATAIAVAGHRGVAGPVSQDPGPHGEHRTNPVAAAVPLRRHERPRRAITVLGGLAAAAAVVVGIVALGHRGKDNTSADAPRTASLDAKTASAASATTAAAAAGNAPGGAAPGAEALAPVAGSATDAASSAPPPTLAITPAAPAATAAASVGPPTTAAAAPPAIADPDALRTWVAAHPYPASDPPLPCAATVAGAASDGRVDYRGTVVQVFTLDARLVLLVDPSCERLTDLPA